MTHPFWRSFLHVFAKFFWFWGVQNRSNTTVSKINIFSRKHRKFDFLNPTRRKIEWKRVFFFEIANLGFLACFFEQILSRTAVFEFSGVFWFFRKVIKKDSYSKTFSESPDSRWFPLKLELFSLLKFCYFHFPKKNLQLFVLIAETFLNFNHRYTKIQLYFHILDIHPLDVRFFGDSLKRTEKMMRGGRYGEHRHTQRHTRINAPRHKEFPPTNRFLLVFEAARISMDTFEICYSQ